MVGYRLLKGKLTHIRLRFGQALMRSETSSDEGERNYTRANVHCFNERSPEAPSPPIGGPETVGLRDEGIVGIKVVIEFLR